MVKLSKADLKCFEEYGYYCSYDENKEEDWFISMYNKIVDLVSNVIKID
jgi:hypothetical protein